MLYLLSIYAAKTAIVVLFLFVMFRVMGKRQVGQMNIYDLAMIVALANAVQNAMTEGKGELAIGLTTSATIVLLTAVLVRVAAHSSKASHVLLGSPTVVLNDGKVLEDHLRRACLTRDELMAAMREHGLTEPSQVRMAVLEVDGTVSIVPKDAGAGSGGAKKKSE